MSFRYFELPKPCALLDFDHFELFRIATMPVPGSKKVGMVSSCIDVRHAGIITPKIAGQALAAGATFFLQEMKPADPVQALAELRKAFDDALSQPQTILPPGVKP